MTPDELLDATDGTIIQRPSDGHVAQKTDGTWYEVGCADPFDRASELEWVDAVELPNAWDQKPDPRLRQLRDLIETQAAYAATLHHDRIIDRITPEQAGGWAQMIAALMQQIEVLDLCPLCPICHGSGWVGDYICQSCLTSGQLTIRRTA